MAAKPTPAAPRTVVPMTLRPRLDLGGYAPEVPLVAKLDGQVLDKPFTVFWGPNGCGKTTVLRMMAAVTGLTGSGAGFMPFKANERRPSSLEEAEGDLGVLAIAEGLPFRNRVRLPGSPEPARAELIKDRFDWVKGIPGVMDARALGWVGQRVWRYAGRDQIAASSKSYFNDMEDMHTQIVRSLRGRNASFGQLLMPEIEKALCWAFATPGTPGDVFDAPPPYKQAENVNDVWTGSLLAPSILYKECSGLESGAPGRTEERWLMLDEPEVGLSIPLQVKVMATLLRVAETGPTRIFMASHSPLVLSLVNHPLVQVVDMSGGWLEAAQYAMGVLNTPKALSKVGVQTEKDLRAAVAKQQKEQEKARLAKEKEQAKRDARRGRDPFGPRDLWRD